MTRSQLAFNVFAALVLIAHPAGFALAEDKKEEGFAERKAHILKELDERAAKLQEHKTCVAAAADRDALKACRGKMKEWRHDEREERMEHKKDRLEKRRERLEEKKKES